MIKITGINHIAIAAPSQLAEMRCFYVDVLGIASVPRAIPKELEERCCQVNRRRPNFSAPFV